MLLITRCAAAKQNLPLCPENCIPYSQNSFYDKVGFWVRLDFWGDFCGPHSWQQAAPCNVQQQLHQKSHVLGCLTMTLLRIRWYAVHITTTLGMHCNEQTHWHFQRLHSANCLGSILLWVALGSLWSGFDIWQLWAISDQFQQHNSPSVNNMPIVRHTYTCVSAPGLSSTDGDCVGPRRERDWHVRKFELIGQNNPGAQWWGPGALKTQNVQEFGVAVVQSFWEVPITQCTHPWRSIVRKISARASTFLTAS